MKREKLFASRMGPLVAVEREGRGAQKVAAPREGRGVQKVAAPREGPR